MNLPAIRFAAALVVIPAGWLAGCETITGINDFTVQSHSSSDGGKDSGADSATGDDGAVGDDGASDDSQADGVGD